MCIVVEKTIRLKHKKSYYKVFARLQDKPGLFTAHHFYKYDRSNERFHVKNGPFVSRAVNKNGVLCRPGAEKKPFKDRNSYQVFVKMEDALAFAQKMHECWGTEFVVRRVLCKKGTRVALGPVTNASDIVNGCRGAKVERGCVYLHSGDFRLGLRERGATYAVR